MTPPDDKPHFDPSTVERDPALAGIAYPESEEAYRAAVQEGLDDLDAGRTISGEAVIAWMRSWFTDNELPPPECGD